MTAPRYRCAMPRRLARVAAAGLNGIDFLEIGPGTGQIAITFVAASGLGALSGTNIRITGGVRFTAPLVAPGPLAAGGPNQLVVTLLPNQPTDYSTYTLTLVDPTGGTPAGFDPESAAVDFSFKVDCPSPFDCAPDGGAPATPPPRDPDLDYTARDWSGFRRLMLDRIATLVPGFADDTPVDSLVTHVEALAYVADHLSYRLDAIANESDLFRARSRISLARHARLLDYAVHEGANARVFAHIAYAGNDGAVLPAGTPLVTETAIPGATLSPDDFAAIAPLEPVTFETMAPLPLFTGNTRLAFHTWSDASCNLPRGATRATLRQRVTPSDPPASLAAGDFLMFLETTSPRTGSTADADRMNRHVVRLTDVQVRTDIVEAVTVLDIAWDAADALPFDLTLTVEIAAPGQPAALVTCAEARGNIVLADHGLTLPVRNLTSPATQLALTPQLDPPAAPAAGSWRPRLTRANVARAAPVDLSVTSAVPAASLLIADPAQALPALWLLDSFRPWQARRDLLSSERFDRHFVVETEYDGTVSLRFGDNVMGQAPEPGQRLTVGARFGRHADGKIGLDVLRQAVTTLPGIIAVANPLPASGGQEALDATTVRIEAPAAFATQQRAVTEADYAEMAERHPAIARARARVRWTGSWRTAFVHVDRIGGLPVETDPLFLAAIRAHMDRYRLCGVDIAVKGAIAAPLAITLSVCITPGALRASVRRALLERLGSGITAGGDLAFFHPDRFTFGTPLYLSQLVAEASLVPGVASVQVLTFQRRGRPDAGERAAGVIIPDDLEVLRLDNDPNFPENGVLELDLVGGA